jgi:glycerophosphoryl diester phosphodiesterase
MSDLYQLHRPVIFAHRGACAHAPENTLASFRMAVEHGADAIELDAKVTADGQVVVIHDPTVERTTGGHGVVHALTLAELRSLDAGSFFGQQFAGERIPLLSEVFEEVASKLFINVELTNYTSAGDGLTELVADLVKKHAVEKRVMFSSFSPINLITARRLLPDVPVGILALEHAVGWLSRGWIGRLAAPQALHPYLSDVNAATILAEHRRNRRVHVWTVNDPADMRRLFQADVDGIFTDDPRLAVQVCHEGGQKVTMLGVD